jgi:hypothetical protein
MEKTIMTKIIEDFLALQMPDFVAEMEKFLKIVNLDVSVDKIKDFQKDYNDSGVDECYAGFHPYIRRDLCIGHCMYYFKQLHDGTIRNTAQYLTKILTKYHTKCDPSTKRMFDHRLSICNAKEQFSYLVPYYIIINGIGKTVVDICKDVDAFTELMSNIEDGFIDAIASKVENEMPDNPCRYPMYVVYFGTPWLENKIQQVLDHGKYVPDQTSNNK